MTSIFFLGLFLTFFATSMGDYTTSVACKIRPPHRTIPLRITQFPGESTLYIHALANAKKKVFNSKCVKALFVRSPHSEIHAAAHISEENLRCGAITTYTQFVTELCPGIWKFQDANNRNNYNINYKLWNDGQSLVDLKRMYINGRFFDDVFAFLSTKRYVTQEEIERGFREANVNIYSFMRISQENCREY